MVLAHDLSYEKRTEDIKISDNITFDTMLLSSNTLLGLKKSGFYKPSPIQLHAIPLGKCGFDLLLEAKSGTGKTAVFTVIALEKLDLTGGLQTVILAPTREIASQIYDVIKQIGASYEGLNVEVVMGGLSVQEDILKFKKNVHIVVGSPGRLRHLIREKHISTALVKLLVLDEADKLMEKSFQADINHIFSILPKQKQVIMSSATYPDNIKQFINNYMQSAQHVCPNTNNILLGIEQRIVTVAFHNHIVQQTLIKFTELLKILSKKKFKQCLIFCNYQARVAELHKMLTKENWPSEQLYGQQDQSMRLGALKTLQEYKCRILIATDLAARGIDASNVDLVINFEPPFDWQTYLHRIGRAGRFGSFGTAITMLNDPEKIKFQKTLLSTGFMFNICYFWSDEKFEINESHTELKCPVNSVDDVESAKISEVKQDTPEDLWKSFTDNKTLNNNKGILSFQDLCASFENTKHIMIQSFSELNTSFENCSETADEHCIHKLREEKNNKECSSETSSLISNDDKIKVAQENNVLEQNNKVEYTENREVDNELNGHVSQLVIDTSKLHERLPTSDVNLEQNENERALIEAGLPTCFATSKGKLKNHSNGYFTHNIKNRVPKDVHSFQITSNHRLVEDSSERSDTDSSGTAEVYIPRSPSYYNNNQTNKNHLKRVGHKKKVTHVKDASRNGSVYKQHQNNTAEIEYFDWYNNLKAQTEQVRLLTYCNIMCREY